MGTYTQLVRDDESGTYTRETKHTPETFYLVEYSTIGTYYKVQARSLDEAQDRMYNVDDDGVESIENPDRIDVMVDDWVDEKDWDIVKEKLEWRKQVAK